MTVSVTFIQDAASQETWQTVTGDDALALIKEHYTAFPDGARIYHGAVARSKDVTPHDGASEAALSELTGEVFVFECPGDPFTIFAIVVAVTAVAAAVYLSTLTPDTALRNTQSESPNNALSGRSNKARPNGRIPDIFGAVRSVPDLLMRPYTRFENNVEVEYNYMCIGRGDYTIFPEEVLDGDTPIVRIAGSTVEIFAPFTSPGNGSPILRIGAAMTEPIFTVFKSNAVNGQTLKAPNDKNVQTRGTVGATTQGFATTDDSPFIFTDQFAPGDVVTVANAVVRRPDVADGNQGALFNANNNTVKFFDDGVAGEFSANDIITFSVAGFAAGQRTSNGIIQIDLAGAYTVASVDTDTITLVDPASVNAGWNTLKNGTRTGTSRGEYSIAEIEADNEVNIEGDFTIASVTPETVTFTTPRPPLVDNFLADFFNGFAALQSSVIQTTRANWVGPFVIDREIDRLQANFVAPQGMFKQDNDGQISTSVSVEMEITRIDESGAAISVFTRNATVVGSKDTRTQRARTLTVDLGGLTRVSVRVRRVTALDLEFEGNVVDEVKIRDLFGFKAVDVADFGNVTTAHTKTIATEGALGVKERKFSLEVGRKIPRRISGETFTIPQATTYAADILTAVATDPEIGGLTLSELNLDSIYDAVDRVDNYFNTNDAVAFSYTFDTDNLAFSEIAQTVARACFCEAYRQGSKLNLTDVIATDDSSLLLNHRNKAPRSDKVNDRFGLRDDVNGLELEWIEPVDDALVKIYIPDDQSATRPNKIETVGVRNYRQAYYHANREHNRILYENGTLETIGLQEAELLPRTARFLNADNTRAITQDGEVTGQTGLIVSTSQPVVFEAGQDYYAHFQLSNGTVQAVPVTAGPSDNEIVLQYATGVPLISEHDARVKTTYIITTDESRGVAPYRLTSSSSNSDMTCNISAVRYTPLVHQHDAVMFWLKDGVKDYGPDGLSINLTNGAAVVADSARGDVVEVGAGQAFQIPDLLASPNYSLCFWIFRAGDGVLFSRAGSEQTVALNASGRVLLNHNGSNEELPDALTVPASVWTHVALSYTAPESGQSLGAVTAYINGKDAGTTDIQAPAQLSFFNVGDSGLSGTRLDDVRYYARAITAEGARAFYKSTRNGI